MKQLLILILLVTQSHSTTELLTTDHIAVQFVVQVENVRLNQLIGVGTLITLNHILTLNSIYDGIQINQDIRLRFRSNILGSGLQAFPERIFKHENENLAIILMTSRVNEQFTFAPRDRSSLLLGRFCTSFGFEGGSLVAVPTFINNCGNYFCSTQNSCSEFSGSPVICDGHSIGGFVISCNNSQFLIDNIDKYNEWIEEVTSGSSKIKFLSFFGLILIKIIF